MEIYKFQSSEQLNEFAAKDIIQILKNTEMPKIGLATGMTPIGLYDTLVQYYKKRKVSFSNVTSYNLDEYVGLEKGHPNSFYSFTNQHLFQHIDISKDRIHIPDGTARDLTKECQRYESILSQANQLDVQVLSIGINGHIGFNEPGPSLSSKTHVVTLTEETRKVNSKFFRSGETCPTRAITMGVGSIMKAKRIVFIARGPEKAEVIKRMVQGPVNTECPGSLLQLHPNILVLLDREAGKYVHSNL